MLELKFVRENLHEVAAKLKKRGLDFDVRGFEGMDSERRQAITEAEKLKAGKNDLSKKIGELKKAKEDAGELMDRVKLMGDEVTKAESRAAELDEKLWEMLKATPNLPHDSVPEGLSAEQNVKTKSWGTPPDFNFVPKPHWELGEALGILDFERATKVTGARFTFYKGLGARLERALIQFMLDTQTLKNGYSEMWTPLMVNSESLYGTGQLPKFKEDLFKIQNAPARSTTGEIYAEALRRLRAERSSTQSTPVEMDEDKKFIADFMRMQFQLENLNDDKNAYYLIPTAEVPVTNYHRDETLDAAVLPLKYAAYTPCFRAEAGAYGRDTKGMVRQHQFNKVELVKFCTPETSLDEHEKLTADAESILEALELPCQRMLLCAGDMGFGAMRANIKVKRADGKKELLHTLNGSGLATSRVFPAILENNQQEDGSIIIPKVLRPYMGGLEKITRPA